jgi:hypothetical protein
MSDHEKDIKAYMVADVLLGEDRKIEADAIIEALDSSWGDYRDMLKLFYRVESFLRNNALKESKEAILNDIAYWTANLTMEEKLKPKFYIVPKDYQAE